MTAPTKLDLRSEEQKLLDMEVHETFEIYDMIILRVIGGWLYTSYGFDQSVSATTFVPLPKEHS